MELLEVICAVYNQDDHRMEIVKDVVWPDGRQGLLLQVFDVTAVASRAALYNTDDDDELYDIMIYEQHIDAFDPMSMPAEEAKNLHRAGRAAFKAKMQTAKAAKGMVKALDKEGKKTKLRAAGVDQKYIDACDVEPIETFKATCQRDPGLVAYCKKDIERARQLKMKAAKPDMSVRGQIMQDMRKQVDAATLQRRKALAERVASAEKEKATPRKVTVHLRKRS